jgi:hypothetical protein
VESLLYYSLWKPILDKSDKLGQIMEQGLPIRDASIGNIGGFYTNLERGMLYQSDWNLFGDYWVPPWY